MVGAARANASTKNNKSRCLLPLLLLFLLLGCCAGAAADQGPIRGMPPAFATMAGAAGGESRSGGSHGPGGGGSSSRSRSSRSSHGGVGGGATALEVVESFQPRAFQPPPLFGRNEHFQTIWGARVLQDALAQALSLDPSAVPPSSWRDVYDRREKWETPDGDFYHGDWLYSAAPSPSSALPSAAKPESPRPVAIVLHGLESNSAALLPRSMAKAFAGLGMDVLALNFRGCCGNDNVQAIAYHLGWTQDLELAVRRLHAEEPRRRIYLSGFSLGGNVILKLLGELGDEAVALGVAGAAVACVPFDAVRSSSKIDTGFNRLVYAKNFLNTLKAKAERKARQHAVPYDLERVLACTRIGDFDDEVICKLHGFEGKVDYYTQSCSKQYLPRIRVPALVVNARDDPFINEAGLPSQADVGTEAPVRLVYHAHGGHCGFLDAREQRGTPEEDRWLPKELARFLDHVQRTPWRRGVDLNEV